MKKFNIIKTLIPFLMLLATHRGESLYIPKDDPSSASKVSLMTRQADGCANIHDKFKKAGTKEGLSFPFSDVKTCYESFTFDNQRRIDTVDTMKKVLGGFYVFTDQAKEQPTQGYDYKPLDILSELDKLGQKNYANDLEFTTDATNLVTELKDPHTIFFPICYTRFAFTQRIVLYATVSDGAHKIKVFKDIVESANDDCEVVRIDGVAAIDAITTFARDKVFVSKDLGVRLNMALASLSLQNGTYLLQPRSSQFNLRMVLPEKETTTYDLKCGTNNKSIQRNWEAVINNPGDLDNFTDAGSYWQSFCANTPVKSNNVKKRRRNPRTSSNAAYNIDPLTVNPEILKELSPSVEVKKLVFDATIAQFYMVENNVGVAVIATFESKDVSDAGVLNTFKNLQAGFKALADNGAKKLVLDMTNNEGGFIFLSHFVNLLLIPNSTPSLPTNFRLNDIVKRAILKASSSTKPAESIFDKGGYLRIDEQPFNNTDEFLASKFIENDLDPIKQFLAANNQIQLPWKSSDMIILTNGFCGSACASTTLLLSELHKVQSVAVGGFPNVPLSFSSFAGGQNFLLDDPLKRGFDLKTDCGTLGITNEPDFPKDLPTNVLFAFTSRRAFSDINSDNALEYAFKPAANHIFFDEESIRDPSKLWSQASALINS